MSCNALMRLGHLEQAEALSVEAFRRFPTDFGVLRSRADCATRRRDWPEAIRRWNEVQKLYPDADGVSAGIDVLRNTIHFEEGPQHDPVAHPVPLLAGHEVSGGAQKQGSLEQPDIFNRFESLGGTCEFGIVQRIGGVHAVGLFRWCAISTQQLIAALQSRFEGVGSPEQTFLTVNESGEYILNDRRYFEKHTFTFVDVKQADPSKLLRRFCHWIVLLRDKLIRDLERGEKIFVYKAAVDATLEEAEAMEVWRAVRQYAPNTVLCVRLQNALHPAGTVEKIADGLLFGYTDRNPTTMDLEGVSYDCWTAVCRAAVALADSAAATYPAPAPIEMSEDHRPGM